MSASFITNLTRALGLECPHCKDDDEKRPGCRACRAMGTSNETHAAIIVDALDAAFDRGRVAGLREAAFLCSVQSDPYSPKRAADIRARADAVRERLKEAKDD